MATKLHVIEVAQVDRGVRFIAVDGPSYRAVCEDRTMLDGITAEACLDVDENGRRTWERPFGCPDSPAGREAIRQHLHDAQ